MGQGTETCTDRPTEVSVIRFVSRNRTIEEIAPKKEIYMCKQRGCGKKFTNHDEYKTHETLEALKIRFICREPDCGEELSDPGSMWRHYQEWHNNETNVFVCPYTSCSSMHATSENLEEHIESCHRQPPTLPMEPEIICFEGPENTINDDIGRSNENDYFDGDVKESKKCNFSTKSEVFALNEYTNKDNRKLHKDDFICDKQIRISSNRDNVSSEKCSSNFPKNEDLLITKENFLIKYETISSKGSECMQVDSNQENTKVVFINGDLTITKNSKMDNSSKQNQEQKLEIDNLDRVFRTEYEKVEESSMEISNNCSEDEEYTPKKQRMSRYKQESYKCDVSGCGKMYKYISHYRHHQDSHKLSANAMNTNSAKVQKPKQRKATTVSFFLCKMPGCGAQVDDVTGLWKHYQDNHANSKLPVDQAIKGNETFRCNVPGCDMEVTTNFMLYKHFNEHHTNSSISNTTKTGNGGSIHYANHMFHDDATTQKHNFKTDFNAKHNDNVTDYSESDNDKSLSLIIKEELRD